MKLHWVKSVRKWCGQYGSYYTAHAEGVRYEITAYRRRCGEPGRRVYHVWYVIMAYYDGEPFRFGRFRTGHHQEVPCKPTYPSRLVKAKEITEKFHNKGA